MLLAIAAFATVNPAVAAVALLLSGASYHRSGDMRGMLVKIHQEQLHVGKQAVPLADIKEVRYGPRPAAVTHDQVLPLTGLPPEGLRALEKALDELEEKQKTAGWDQEQPSQYIH